MLSTWFTRVEWGHFIRILACDTDGDNQLMPSDPPPATDFASILRVSLIRQMTYKATCQTCKQFGAFSSRRSIPSSDLPPVLAVNASVYNEDNMKLWLDNRQSRFLSPSVEVRGEVDGVDEAMGVVYELRVSCFLTCCSCAHLWFV